MNAVFSASYMGRKKFDVQDRVFVEEDNKSYDAYFRCDLPQYVLCNLSVSQTFYNKVKLTLGVDNIFNYVPKTLGSGITMFNVPATPGTRGWVQRFTNAVARALTWIAGHDAAETAAIIAPQFPDTGVSVLTQVVQRYKDIDAWNATPVMAQSSLERLETVMETAGVLEHADWVDFDRLVDNSYAHNAAR